MKTLALTLTALFLTYGAVNASTVPANLALTLNSSAADTGSATSLQSASALTLAPAGSAEMFSGTLVSGSASHFAQFDTPSKALPVSPGMIFALVALFVVGMRLMGVRQALAMAEHERHSNQGRAQMFRALLEERAHRS